MNELEKLLAQATPRPWHYRPERFDDWGTIRATPLPGEEVGGFVAFARGGNNHLGEEVYMAHRANKTDPYYANAALIVAAVNALPELLAKVKRLEAQCKALSYVHEGAVTQAREYLQEQLGVTIDPIDMSDAIGAYLEVVTRAALNQETKP